ncbi:MAG: hypothetical protein ACFE8U_14965 [Candidatus Hermodarchaeota archaeon]
MDDQDLQLIREIKDPLNPQMTPTVSKGVIRILAIISATALVLGFFIIISIVVAFKNYSKIIHTHGLVVGFLLLGGGGIMLVSLIFVNHATKAIISTDSSHSNQNEHSS